MEFGGDLNINGTVSPAYRYSSQGQENQIDTKWSSYRWRNYDAGMARFFNVDPLSEKYAYQSHYNFSENRVVDGRELEGLEKVQINEEEPLLDRAKNGLNTFFNGVSNFLNEKLNIGREVQISKNPSISKELILQKNSAKAAALGEMGHGLSETMKGSAYALGEVLDKGGEYVSTTALTVAPATEGASLSVVGPAEIISNIGWGIKFGVDLSDEKYSDVLTQGSKKLISIGIGKVGNGLLDKTFKANPTMTKTEKAIHETVVGGTATVVSKSAEKVVDEKTKKK